MDRYTFTIDHVEYDAWKGGRPFTLAEIWREIEGVGNARIWHGARLVLDNAGAVDSRRYAVRARYTTRRLQAQARRLERHAAAQEEAAA